MEYELRDRHGGKILWDDVAGTVSGTSEEIPYIEKIFAHVEEKGRIDIMVMPFVLRLRRPRFDKADFMGLMINALGGGPEDYALPPALQDVDLRKVPKYRVE